MARDTHKTRLLQYLKDYGSITSLDAIRNLGNTRLSATVFALKNEGHTITSEDEKVPTRWLKKDGTPKYTTITKYVFGDFQVYRR